MARRNTTDPLLGDILGQSSSLDGRYTRIVEQQSENRRCLGWENVILDVVDLASPWQRLTYGVVTTDSQGATVWTRTQAAATNAASGCQSGKQTDTNYALIYMEKSYI